MSYLIYAEENMVRIWDDELKKSTTIVNNLPSHFEALQLIIHHEDAILKKYLEMKGEIK